MKQEIAKLLTNGTIVRTFHPTSVNSRNVDGIIINLKYPIDYFELDKGIMGVFRLWMMKDALVYNGEPFNKHCSPYRGMFVMTCNDKITSEPKPLGNNLDRIVVEFQSLLKDNLKMPSFSLYSMLADELGWRLEKV
jgi:hypothetical protein